MVVKMRVSFVVFGGAAKATARGIVFAHLILAPGVLAGCVDSTREFINLRGWTRSPDTSISWFREFG